MLAYHIDLTCPMWRKDYLLSWLSRLTGWGYNMIVLELGDKFRFQQHPGIASPDAFTSGELAEFATSCRSAGLEIMPLIQSLGHSEYILSKPEYAHLRASPDVLDQYAPCSEEVISLVSSMFDEVAGAVAPFKFFHIGGDETYCLRTVKDAGEMENKLKPGEVYLRHMMPLFERLRHKGLRPVIWADMILSYPEIIQKIPRDVVLMDWDYFTDRDRVDKIRVWGGDTKTGKPISVDWSQCRSLEMPEFKRCLEPHAVDDQTSKDGTFRGFYCADALRAQGFGVMTASANRCWGSQMGIPDAQRMANCFFSARKAAESGLMGNVVTSWACRRTHPEVLLPATYAAAKAAATNTVFDPVDICRRFTADFHGVELPDFAAAMAKANRALRWPPSLSQFHSIKAARNILMTGRNPITEILGGRSDLELLKRDTEEALLGYNQATESFRHMRNMAKKNSHNFDYWIDGLETDAFYARFMLAAIEGKLDRQAKILLEELEDLRLKSRVLMLESYTHVGAETELDLRYGLFEECLKGAFD